MNLSLSEIKNKIINSELSLDIMYEDLKIYNKKEIELKYSCSGKIFIKVLKFHGLDVKTFTDYERDRKNKIVLECFVHNKVIVDISKITNINSQTVSKILRESGFGNEISMEYGIDKKNKIVGNKYGFLKVLSYYGRDDKTNYVYNCICENCGNEIKIRGNYLTSNKKTDCGCLTKKKQSDARKKYNNFDLSGDFGLGYTNNGGVYYFDLEDYDKIKEYCWGLHYGYIKARDVNLKKHISIHRIVMNCDDKSKQIDHINRNPMDNRKCNLRICTNAENSRNKNVKIGNNTGFTGVSKRENGTYRVRIRKDGRELTIGHYLDIKEAIINRLKAEKEIYGEFAPQKHLFEQYGIVGDSNE